MAGIFYPSYRRCQKNDVNINMLGILEDEAKSDFLNYIEIILIIVE